MKSLRDVSEALRKARSNQPKSTLVQAQAQAKRVKNAANKAGAKSGPPVIVTQERWEDVLKACVDSEAEVEHLQEEMEKMSADISDKEENYIRVLHECNRLTTELGIGKVVHTKAIADYEICIANLTRDLETRIANLTRNLENTESNKKYACDHISEQNKLIRDAKSAMESLRAENEQLKSKQVNAEHLAKKVIQLQEELVKSDSYKCPFRKTQNNTIHIPCGKCIGCKLDAAYGIIDRSVANVKHLEGQLRKVEEELQFKTAILDQTSQNLIKSHEDKASVEKIYSQSLTESNALASALQSEKTHLQAIITLQKNGLEVIARWGTFFRKSIARNIPKLVAKYKDENNML
jgi:chromosome segregation ATPase